MIRSAPLLLVADPAQVSSGLQPDRHSLFQPLWEAAANVVFRQGKVQRLVPPALMFNTSLNRRFNGLHQQQTSDGTRWVWTADTTGEVHRWFGPAREFVGGVGTVVPNQTGTQSATIIDFQAWGNWTLVNNPNGSIMRYQPAVGLTGASFAALPNAPTNAIAIMKKQNQLLAIGHGLNRKLVSFSHADDITVWAATSTNLAGQLPIEELDTGIRAACRLGEFIACYAEDQLAFVYRTGAPFYFGQRVQLDGIGAVGKKAVCADGRLNYGLSRNGVWRTDGNEYNYIDEGVIGDYLQANVNWDQASKAVVFRNDVTRCIEVHFPRLGLDNNTEAWSYDPQTQGWSPLPAYQMLAERQLFRKPLAANMGDVWLLEDDPNVLAPLTLRTKPLLMQSAQGQPLHLGARIDELEFMLKAAVAVEFRYNCAEDIDGPWMNSAWQALAPDQRLYQLEAMPSATYHQVEFRSTLAAWQFDLQGFAFFGASEGQKRASL